jgi:hydrogenase-4 component F
MARYPLLAIPLVTGLLVAFGALLMHLNTIAFGEPTGENAPSRASYLPLYAHLAVVLAAGIFLPPLLVHWFQGIAVLLG